MEILFTICGRAGSKGLKNKNLKDFVEKPLALYSLSTIDLYLKENKDINADIAINTDSKELKEMFLNSQIMDVDTIDRTEDLAGDRVAKIDVIRDSLIRMEKTKNKKYDYIVDLDITSPIRTVNNLSNLINKMIETKSELVFSVTEARRNPYFNMIKRNDSGGYEKVIDSDFVARQQAPEIFDMNASMYIYSNDFLMSGRGLFDSKYDIIKMVDTGVLDIDKEDDLLLMEVIGGYFFNNKEEYKVIRDNIK